MNTAALLLTPVYTVAAGVNADNISLYRTLSYVFLGLAILFAVISVVLFIRFKIPRVYSFLTGRAQRQSIQRMQEQSFQSGEMRGDEYRSLSSADLYRTPSGSVIDTLGEDGDTGGRGKKRKKRSGQLSRQRTYDPNSGALQTSGGADAAGGTAAGAAYSGANAAASTSGAYSDTNAAYSAGGAGAQGASYEDDFGSAPTELITPDMEPAFGQNAGAPPGSTGQGFYAQAAGKAQPSGAAGASTQLAGSAAPGTAQPSDAAQAPGAMPTAPEGYAQDITTSAVAQTGTARRDHTLRPEMAPESFGGKARAVAQGTAPQEAAGTARKGDAAAGAAGTTNISKTAGTSGTAGTAPAGGGTTGFASPDDGSAPTELLGHEGGDGEGSAPTELLRETGSGGDPANSPNEGGSPTTLLNNLGEGSAPTELLSNLGEGSAPTELLRHEGGLGEGSAPTELLRETGSGGGPANSPNEGGSPTTLLNNPGEGSAPTELLSNLGTANTGGPGSDNAPAAAGLAGEGSAPTELLSNLGAANAGSPGNANIASGPGATKAGPRTGANFASASQPKPVGTTLLQGADAGDRFSEGAGMTTLLNEGAGLTTILNEGGSETTLLSNLDPNNAGANAAPAWRFVITKDYMLVHTDEWID